ncbi:hypothetical protein [Candidatus Sororendozoicomonas aggregata]|uniref:hypothetical protein n=1 Tax=Candidatus Sororendozoicomonas aggregata TaxID=3073239 RepID=UPI002ED17F67
MTDEIKKLLYTWQDQLEEKKELLRMAGDRGDSSYYNLLATEALTLSVCIGDVLSALEESR